MFCYLLIFYVISPDIVFRKNVNERRRLKSKDDSRAKYKAILSDYSGFSWLKT